MRGTTNHSNCTNGTRGRGDGGGDVEVGCRGAAGRCSHGGPWERGGVRCGGEMWRRDGRGAAGRCSHGDRGNEVGGGWLVAVGSLGSLDHEQVLVEEFRDDS